MARFLLAVAAVCAAVVLAALAFDSTTAARPRMHETVILRSAPGAAQAAAPAQAPAQGPASPYVAPSRARSADNGAAKSDLRNAVTVMESYYTDHQTYAGDLGPLFPAAVTVISADAQSYALTATDVGGRTYGITRDATGAFDHTCSPSDQRGCRDGTW